MPRLLNNPAHWHLRAQEVQLLASKLEDPVAGRNAQDRRGIRAAGSAGVEARSGRRGQRAQRATRQRFSLTLYWRRDKKAPALQGRGC
jgi:hypothetical protein